MVGAVALFLVAASLDADPAFQQAQGFYEKLDYEQAILRFEEIAVRPSLSKPEKARALLWLGLSYAGVADFDSARRYLKSALDADATIALPDKVSPRVSKLFAELRAEAGTTTTTGPPDDGATVVTTRPDGSSIVTTPSKKGGTNAGIVVGTVLTVAAAVAIIGAATTGGLAAYNWSVATTPGQFQDTAKAAADATNGDLLFTAILAPSGLIIGAIGGTLIALNVE